MRDNAKAAVLGTISSVAIVGTIGSYVSRNPKTGAAVGAAIGGAMGAIGSGIMFCGMFRNKEEQEAIDRELMPKQTISVLAGAFSAYAATALAIESKKGLRKTKHPLVLPIAVGAAASAVTNLVTSVSFFSECPKPQVGTSSSYPEIASRNGRIVRFP